MEDLGIDRKWTSTSQTKALGQVEGSYTYFADGDVLLAKITPCFENGKLGIASNLVNGVGFGSSEYFVLRPAEELSPEWLYYFLSRSAFRVDGAKSMTGAVGHKRVSKEFVEQHRIPLPPLPEQQRIVAILDEAFDGIARAKANAEKNLANARAIFERFREAVFTQKREGWTQKPLGALAIFRNGINYTKGSKGDSVKVVGVGDFRNEYWVPTKNLTEVSIDGRVSPDDLLQSGDILTVRSNGNIALIGRSMLAGEVPAGVTHSGFTIRSRLISDELKPSYLCHFLRSDTARKRLVESGTGTNIKSLNQQALSQLRIPVAPPVAQDKIVKQIELLSLETRNLEAVYRRKLDALDALKQSVLHQAFSGAL